MAGGRCFDLLYVFIIVRLDRRGLVWINVTTNPAAEWIARQLTEVFPWDEAPHYLIRDRDQMADFITTTSGFRFSVHTAGAFLASPLKIQTIRAL